MTTLIYMATMTEVREAFDAAIRAWNEGDLNRYLDLYAENISLYGYSDAPMGKVEVRELYEGIFAALSDLSLEIHEVVEDGLQLGCAVSLCTGPIRARWPVSLRPVDVSHSLD